MTAWKERSQPIQETLGRADGQRSRPDQASETDIWMTPGSQWGALVGDGAPHRGGECEESAEVRAGHKLHFKQLGWRLL